VPLNIHDTTAYCIEVQQWKQGQTSNDPTDYTDANEAEQNDAAAYYDEDVRVNIMLQHTALNVISACNEASGSML
jgi:hypothetical protein